MKKSAGILVYRKTGDEPEYFLVHPGGPFWKSRDAGVWSIPKGEFTDGEDAEQAARREFQEETSISVTGKLHQLKSVKQKSGKWVFAFYAKKDFDAGSIKSNEFELEWPPKSGRKILIPEVDRAGWFTIVDAREKILPGQLPLLDELDSLVNVR
ncbi:MAG: NUDIX domain-containing protein [Chitinophagaceae bacterium]